MTRARSLDGVWKLAWASGQRGRLEYQDYRGRALPARYLDAQVPGEVHLDLVRAGWIADPYVGTHVLACRWVEEMLWSYRREFAAPAAARAARAWLVFDRLDLAATIRLNGEIVGTHANTFVPCRIEVTGGLKPRNVVRVDVEAGLYHAADKRSEGYEHGVDQKLHKRHWLRKPQSQAEWDWAPRLLNVGITGPVRLEWTADAVRADQLVPLAEVSEDLRRGTVRVRWFVEGLRTSSIPARLEVDLRSPGGRVAAAAVAKVEVKPGLHPVEAVVAVDGPALWWPAGHGDQPRYRVHARLRVEGRVVAEDSARIGFRRVQVSQDPHPAGGRWFVLEVNGRPIFCKGANLVPADMITAAITRERYERLVRLAREANFNLLRVWGGGLYEADDFYDLCDEAGLLVWQEFIFACAKYPGHDETFLDDVLREARHQVRRLARHPSLVVWCGNNEMEEGTWHWGYTKRLPYPDYGLFHHALPRLLKEEDPTRYYQPSSPYSPDGLDPNRPDTGDQHPWTVGFHHTDFRDYRTMTHRFPNEGGILGPCARPTVAECLAPANPRVGRGGGRLDGLAWDVHENSIAFWADRRPPDRMLEAWLGLRREAMTLDDWVYWGGVVQGEGLSEYIRNFRRRMFSSAAAVFWMYNDTWPAVRSWTIVDYRLRRTPSFHPVRRAFAPVALVVVREGEAVRAYGVNDGREPVTGDLRYGFLALAGRYPVDETRPVTLPPNASTLLAEWDGRAWDRLGVRTHAAFARLTRAGGVEIARDRLFLPRFRELRWPRVRVRVRLEGGRAVFTADAFAWRVCLDLDGEAPLPDNFFDVWPGVPTVLPWPRRLGRPRIVRVGNRLSPDGRSRS